MGPGAQGQIHDLQRPLSAEAKQDIGFVYADEGKSMLQGWSKLFYNTERLLATAGTKEYAGDSESVACSFSSEATGHWAHDAP